MRAAASVPPAHFTCTTVPTSRPIRRALDAWFVFYIGVARPCRSGSSFRTLQACDSGKGLQGLVNMIAHARKHNTHDHMGLLSAQMSRYGMCGRYCSEGAERVTSTCDAPSVSVMCTAPTTSV